MSELRAQERHGQMVIDSRDVARMVDKKHKDLTRNVRTYIDYLAGSNFAPGDYFIESSYLDANNQERPCYLITKKGCDMIANKLTGRKGVLFTAAYVTAFDEMEQRLKHDTPAPLISPSGLAQLIRVTRRIMLDMGSSANDVGQMAKQIYQTWNVPVPQAFERQINSQLCLFDAQVLRLEN